MTMATDANLTWMLESLVEQTAGANHALVLSRDGLKLCHTSALSVDKADQLAAIAAGVQALSQGASMEFGDGTGGVRHSMTEFHGGILFIVEAGEGAHLAVLAAEEADVDQIGAFLTAPPRRPEHTSPS